MFIVSCEPLPVDVQPFSQVEQFASQQNIPVMIISYEMFVRGSEVIEKLGFDLLVCDEAHRLKNPAIKTTHLLASLPCRRRILMTGTPIQNDLQVEGIYCFNHLYDSHHILPCEKNSNVNNYVK